MRSQALVRDIDVFDLEIEPDSWTARCILGAAQQLDDVRTRENLDERRPGPEERPAIAPAAVPVRLDREPERISIEGDSGVVIRGADADTRLERAHNTDRRLDFGLTQT